MKQFLFLIATLLWLTTFAQPTGKLTVADSAKYRMSIALNTPLSNIRLAGLKWKGGDTAGTLHYLQAATKTGLFDTSRITGSQTLAGFTKTAAWPAIKAGIHTNKQRISSPKGLEIHTEDVQRFVQLYPQLLQKGADSVLWKEYILKGSTGLKTFYEVRMGSQASEVVHTIQKAKNFYAGLQPLVQQLPLFRQQIMRAAQKLEQLYPEAIFPPLYFLVGKMSAAGTPDGGAGQLIGIEFFSNYPGRDTTELNEWVKSVLADTSRLVGVTVHEMIHVQQNGPEEGTVLSKCINEGMADFLTYLTLNKILLPRQHAYGNAHQRELYQRLLKEKDSTDVSHWLYNPEVEATGVPVDIGYYIGYKICEAYYARQADKKKAIWDMLNLKNYQDFFDKSGYGQGM